MRAALPKGWEDAPFGEVANIVTGTTPSKTHPEFYGGDIPFITPAELNGLPVVSNAPTTLSLQGVKQARLLPKDSVMVSCIGTLGKVAMAGCPLVTNQQINALVFDEKKIFPVYGYYYCLTIRRELEKLSSSTTIPIVNKARFSELRISFPTLSEQKRIAAILDKADAIRRKRQQAIHLADDLLRSVFLDMFGDPVTNPKAWDVCSLSKVGRLARGKSKHRPRNDPILLGGKYPLVQTGDVANANHFITDYTQTYSELGLRQSKLWPAKTLCITIAANIADTAILTFDACFPDSIVGFAPGDQVRTEYIHMWLTFYQRILRDKAPESAQKNINLRILSELQVPIPPIELQDEFVKVFYLTEELKGKMRESSGESDDAFFSLTQRAFRGEI